VGPWACLDPLEERKILPLQGIKAQTVQSTSYPLYW
jgi:hypothetical protein